MYSSPAPALWEASWLWNTQWNTRPQRLPNCNLPTLYRQNVLWQVSKLSTVQRLIFLLKTLKIV